MHSDPGGHGLSPDGSASYQLPRLIGVRRTQDLMLTNRRLTADEALQWGMVNYVVDDAELGSFTDTLAAELAAGAAQSHAVVKKLLLATFGNGIETQMELEGRFIAANANADGPDGREGIDAFLAKRKPDFG